MELTVVVLAGGRSRRFGCLKAMIEVEGKPLIHHVLDRIADVTENVVVAAKSDLLKFLDLPKVRVVPDKLDLHAPIIGIISSLEQVETDYAAVLPCDSPFVNLDVVILLFEMARGRSGALPLWESGEIEPLHAVYRTRELEEKAWKCLNKGDLRVRCIVELMEDIAYVPVELLRKVDPELLTFLNINSKDDLRRINEILKGNSRS